MINTALLILIALELVLCGWFSIPIYRYLRREYLQDQQRAAREAFQRERGEDDHPLGGV